MLAWLPRATARKVYAESDLKKIRGQNLLRVYRQVLIGGEEQRKDNDRLLRISNWLQGLRRRETAGRASCFRGESAFGVLAMFRC